MIDVDLQRDIVLATAEAPKLTSMSLEELLEALDDQINTLRKRRRSKDRRAKRRTSASIV